jgi:hypothetical protein
MCAWTSELQTCLTGGIGDRSDAAVVVKATAIEHDS